MSEKLIVLNAPLSRRCLLSWTALASFGLAKAALAEDPANVGSITSIAPRIAMQGKLATHTEIVEGQGQAPMLSLGRVARDRG